MVREDLQSKSYYVSISDLGWPWRARMLRTSFVDDGDQLAASRLTATRTGSARRSRTERHHPNSGVGACTCVEPTPASDRMHEVELSLLHAPLAPPNTIKCG